MPHAMREASIFDAPPSTYHFPLVVRIASAVPLALVFIVCRFLLYHAGTLQACWRDAVPIGSLFWRGTIFWKFPKNGGIFA